MFINVCQLNLSYSKALDKSNKQHECHLNFSHCKIVDKTDEPCENGKLADPLLNLVL